MTRSPGTALSSPPGTQCSMVSKHHIAIVSATIVSSIASIGASAQSAQAEHPINSVRGIRTSLRACWISPAMRAPPQVTVRLSFKRNGEILGQPLISYQNPDATEDERAELHVAVAAALARCTPLPISDALGGIIAGHPINVKLGEGWRRRGVRNGSRLTDGRLPRAVGVSNREFDVDQRPWRQSSAVLKKGYDQLTRRPL